MGLDPQLGSSSGAVSILIQSFGSETGDVAHDVADVCSLRTDFHFNHHSLRVFLTTGLIEEGVIALYRLLRSLEASLGALYGSLGLFVQYLIAGESGDEAYFLLILSPVHKLLGAKMTVAPENDHSVGPTMAQMLDR